MGSATNSLGAHSFFHQVGMVDVERINAVNA